MGPSFFVRSCFDCAFAANSAVDKAAVFCLTAISFAQKPRWRMLCTKEYFGGSIVPGVAQLAPITAKSPCFVPFSRVPNARLAFSIRSLAT